MIFLQIQFYYWAEGMRFEVIVRLKRQYRNVSVHICYLSSFFKKHYYKIKTPDNFSYNLWD